nr:unnamed protein product [Callosobruchus analis]
MAFTTSLERHVDIIVACEPNKKFSTEAAWLTDTRLDVAIYIVNKKIEVYSLHHEEGIVALGLKSVVLLCGYCSPNSSIEEFEDFLRNIKLHLRHKGNYIVMGDFNAKSALWGSPVTDRRGRILSEWISAMNLVVLNEGDTPTFQRYNNSSFIDVTFASQKVAKDVNSWSVLDSESLSDHRHILIDLGGKVPQARKRSKYKKLLDKEKLLNILGAAEDSLTNTEIEAEQLTYQLKEAYRASTITRGSMHNADVPYWWNIEIEIKRSECIRTRRILTRLRRRAGTTSVEYHITTEAYKTGRQALRRLIRLSKKEHWRKLCIDVDNDIWGDGYRIVSKSLTNNTPWKIPKDYYYYYYYYY